MLTAQRAAGATYCWASEEGGEDFAMAQRSDAHDFHPGRRRPPMAKIWAIFSARRYFFLCRSILPLAVPGSSQQQEGKNSIAAGRRSQRPDFYLWPGCRAARRQPRKAVSLEPPGTLPAVARTVTQSQVRPGEGTAAGGKDAKARQACAI